MKYRTIDEYLKLPPDAWKVDDALALFPSAASRLLAKPPKKKAQLNFAGDLVMATPRSSELLAAAVGAASGAKAVREMAARLLATASYEEALAAGRAFVGGGYEPPPAKSAIKGIDAAVEMVTAEVAPALYRALTIHWEPEARIHANAGLGERGEAPVDAWAGSNLAPKACRGLLRLGVPGANEGSDFFGRFRPHHRSLFDRRTDRLYQLTTPQRIRDVTALGFSATEFFIGMRELEGDPCLVCGDHSSADLDDMTFRLSELNKAAGVYTLPNDSDPEVALRFVGPRSRRSVLVPFVAAELEVSDETASQYLEATDSEPSPLQQISRRAAENLAKSALPEGFHGIVQRAVPCRVAVELISVGGSRSGAVSALKSALGLGTKEALSLLKDLPATVGAPLPREESMALLLALRATGAEARLQ